MCPASARSRRGQVLAENLRVGLSYGSAVMPGTSPNEQALYSATLQVPGAAAIV